MARKSSLTARQWLKIQARYEGGDKVKDIARDWHLSASAISMRARKEGWVHGDILVKKEIAVRAREKVVEDTVDEHAARIKHYLNGNIKRVGDMYDLFDRLRYVLGQKSNVLALQTTDAIKKAQEQTEKNRLAALAKAAVSGVPPESVPYNIIYPAVPDMGKSAVDALRLAEMLAKLDTTHRRMLGLDGAQSPEDENDPISSFLSDIAKARDEYERRHDANREELEDLKGIASLIGKPTPIDCDLTEDDEDEDEGVE